jgi:thiosulfate/3-mercaptopyruvate sulfurtransferase
MNIYSTLITTDVLFSHIGDPDWIIVDTRGDLANAAWGFEEYQRSHIPGAVYAHMDRDLAGPITPSTGRHPLPDPHTLANAMSRLGIGDRTQVIAYDTQGGSWAARLWWMLRCADHPAAAVLDGGFQKWVSEARPTASGVEIKPTAAFSGTLRDDWIATAEDVERIRLDSAYRLIDARVRARFLGEQEPIDAEAGRIPGSVNRFHGENLAPDGTFLPPEILRKQFLDLLDGVPPERAVVYCGSGVTSCHNLLAMEWAGIPGARMYAGSWSEWIRDPDRPRAAGEP